MEQAPYKGITEQDKFQLVSQLLLSGPIVLVSARTRPQFSPPLTLSWASYDDTRVDKHPKGISDIVDAADIIEAPQLSLAY